MVAPEQAQAEQAVREEESGGQRDLRGGSVQTGHWQIGSLDLLAGSPHQAERGGTEREGGDLSAGAPILRIHL